MFTLLPEKFTGRRRLGHWTISSSTDSIIGRIHGAIVAAIVAAMIGATIAPTGCSDDRPVYTPYRPK